MADTRSVFTRAGEGPCRVLERGTSLISIASSVTETDIFTSTIPAGIMGINRLLRCSIFYTRLNNSGATETAPTFRIYTGGTVRFADASIALANAANWVPGQAVFILAMQNATNTMILGGAVHQGIATAPTTGIGDLAANTALIGGPIGSATGTTFTQGTAVDWALRVTWQNGTNNANVTFRRHYAVLELL